MKNVVFIVSIKDSTKDATKRFNECAYDLCLKNWSIWCNKNNCELFVLDKRIYPLEQMNPNWHKLFVFDLLEANDISYDQIMIVDADTMIHPDAPNVFNITDHKYCAIRNYGSMDWVCRSYEIYKTLYFPNVTYSPIDYFNSGVIILNKNHKNMYDKCKSFYLANYEEIIKTQKTFYLGTDQPVLNFFVRQENVDLKLLGYEWNMQDMNRFEVIGPDMLYTRHGWIYHFNGGLRPHPRAWMEETYKFLHG